MKKPTTPYSIDVQDKVKINHDFLIRNDWYIKEEKPLFNTYTHKKSDLLNCSIGLYGELSIVELHWCNKTPERMFTTCNPELTEEDYFTIIRMLNINI